MLRKLFPLAFAFAFGCHKAAPPPTCDQVAAHLHQVIEGSVAAHEGLEVASEAAMAGQCRTSAYSDEVRRCLVGVTKPAEIAACRKRRGATVGSGR
jgi:hypothetical protein